MARPSGMPTAANFYHARVRVVRARILPAIINTYACVRLSEKWPPVAAIDIKDRYPNPINLRMLVPFQSILSQSRQLLER